MQSPASVAVLSIFFLSLCSADAPLQLTHSLYIVIGIAGFQLLLIAVCCLCIALVCCVNSRESRAARRKSHGDRSNDYVTMSELGDSPKKEDLSASRSESKLPGTPSTPPSQVGLDPTPRTSTTSFSDDTEPLIPVSTFKDQEPTSRERVARHQIVITSPATPVGQQRSAQREKCEAPHHPKLCTTKIDYSSLTPGGRRVVHEGVNNPLYEDQIVPNINELISKLHSVRDKWFLIGLQLKLSTSVLNAIRRNNPTAEACLEKMCEKWLDACGEKEPPWFDIVRALESRVVCEPRLADTIRVYYCEDTAMESDEFYTKID